ncbi:MAG: L-rhamnose mutarotase [Actinomycetes bacterium]|jgi:L-rhamnose mutarotase
MERVAFRLKVRAEMMDEYARRHEAVWPEMLDALRSTGWTNYSIFLDRTDGALFGYFETPDLAAALAGMGNAEINEKWQKDMAPFFENLDGVNADQGFTKLEHVFFLQ